MCIRKGLRYELKYMFSLIKRNENVWKGLQKLSQHLKVALESIEEVSNKVLVIKHMTSKSYYIIKYKQLSTQILYKQGWDQAPRFWVNFWFKYLYNLTFLMNNKLSLNIDAWLLQTNYINEICLYWYALV